MQLHFCRVAVFLLPWNRECRAVISIWQDVFTKCNQAIKIILAKRILSDRERNVFYSRIERFLTASRKTFVWLILWKWVDCHSDSLLLFSIELHAEKRKSKTCQGTKMWLHRALNAHLEVIVVLLAKTCQGCWHVWTQIVKNCQGGVAGCSR